MTLHANIYAVPASPVDAFSLIEVYDCESHSGSIYYFQDDDLGDIIPVPASSEAEAWKLLPSYLDCLDIP